MKRNRVLFTFFSLIIIIIIVWTIPMKKNYTDLDYIEKGQVVFNYEDINICNNLLVDDLSKIKGYFNNKKLYTDSPSCGFSKNIAIILDDKHTLCIARDACPIIYWKEKDKYFNLSDKEKKQLYVILEKYGFVFPCV